MAIARHTGADGILHELKCVDPDTTYGYVTPSQDEILKEANLLWRKSRPKTLQELAASQNGMLYAGDVYRVCREHWVYHGYEKMFGTFNPRSDPRPLPCQWVRENCMDRRTRC